TGPAPAAAMNLPSASTQASSGATPPLIKTGRGAHIATSSGESGLALVHQANDALRQSHPIVGLNAREEEGSVALALFNYLCLPSWPRERSRWRCRRTVGSQSG